MKKFIIALITLSFTFSLTGCVTALDKNFQFEKSSNDSVIVGSVTIKDECHRIVTLYTKMGPANSLYHLEDVDLFAKAINTKNDPDNIKDGMFFLQKMDAGKYNIGRLEMYTTDSMVNGMYSDKDLFTVILKPNKVNYIGNIQFTVGPDCAHFVGRIVDDWDNTKSMYSQRMNKIPASSVVKNLATFIKK